METLRTIWPWAVRPRHLTDIQCPRRDKLKECFLQLASPQSIPVWPPLATRSQTGWLGSLQGPGPGPASPRHSPDRPTAEAEMGPRNPESDRKTDRSRPGTQRGSLPSHRPESPEAWYGGWPTSHSPWRSGHHQALPHSHPGHPEAPCALEEAFWPLHYALPTFWKCHCLHVGRGLLDYDSQ